MTIQEALENLEDRALKIQSSIGDDTMLAEVLFLKDFIEQVEDDLK